MAFIAKKTTHYTKKLHAYYIAHCVIDVAHEIKTEFEQQKNFLFFDISSKVPEIP